MSTAKCKQCGKPIPKNKLIYGQLYCNEKCKKEFNGWKNKFFIKRCRAKKKGLIFTIPR